jgi:ATP synthase F1 complex assembly factor 2
MKRFWDTVGIEKRGDSLIVTLDKRPLKTPSGNTLLLPSKKTLLASLIAAEWDHQVTLLKPHALPVVG